MSIFIQLNLRNVLYVILDPVIILSINANLNTVLRLRIFLAQEAHRLNVPRDSEEHNHVGSCCLGIGQGRDMLFGNLSEI